jgi:hypothetical protein
MLLTFQKTNTGEQSVDFRAQMSEPELNFLINYAIESLIQIGAIAVQQQSNEPQEVKLPITQTIVPANQVN